MEHQQERKLSVYVCCWSSQRQAEVKDQQRLQGTFLHPKLAIDFARWISPDFAVWCDEQVANILNQKVFPKSFPDALRLYADEVEKNQLLEQRNQKLIKDYDILEDKAFDNWELFRLYLRPTKDDLNKKKNK